jgi:hypothetical protein
MKRWNPGSLLANEPDTVNNLLCESSLAFHTLREDEITQRTPSLKIRARILFAASGANVVKIQIRREPGPAIRESLLTPLDIGFFERGWQSLP